jgi:type I restriction enzyme S subunit
MEITVRQHTIRPGYKQTDMGIVPEECEVKTLKSLHFDISDGNYSSKYPKASDFRLIGVPFIRANNVRDMDIVDDDMRFISSDQHKELQKGHLKKNDILITTRGDIGQIALVPDRHIDSNINAQIVRINTDDQGVDHRFFAYSMRSKSSQAQLNNLQTGSALKQLPVGKLVQLQLVIPPLPEQRVIAGVLGDADALIGELNRLIAKKRDVKQAAMQQLLTGQQRLPGFNGKWVMKTLGELFTFGGGYSASRDQLSSEGYCYLHYGDIHKSSKVFIDVCSDYQDIPKLTIPLNRVSPVSLLEDGDVVFVDASEDDEGTSRHVVIVNKDKTPFISGLHTIVAKSKTNELSHQYRRYCIQTAAIRRQFYFFAVGTKVSGISKGNITKLTLPIPSIPEQNAIASVLTDIDAELAAMEQRLGKTRAIKQGMMQELLTGKTRLI